ncbi:MULTISPECIES: CaiB/BaiF CoA-transferase family protein [unclassified Pseudofrankia]|uniref:CaiB/BaiF CoA transferase family protein n=1 Tax=unclassified Pseudofrankia TaxID=2994372 RepID=UPI0008D9FA54|nr:MULTISPECIES: CaiB/BaiF CoA-transferase family protein [unclassified Pseudofrankia]MDT3444917.1 CaiB/BaiF CoA-transferase family protein [Pseudofrankia sp. BMG5.37]OHV64826.1 formyl-CoA transferase [Pseudofrankia sp. BMG5.36]
MQHKPLQDIRILEIGGYISTPYATSLLCALGAEIVKVEKPGGGDDFRRTQNTDSKFWVQYNAGKRSLAVDLKHPDGIALVKALIPRFDVVMENMRPGKMTGLGLGQAECARLRPDLVYSSVTGFGSGGPLEQRPAYDTIGQAVGGLYSVLSNAGQAQLAGTCMADLITGLTNAAGVLAALVGRARTGSGQHVETSLMEAVSTLTVDALTQYYDDGKTDPSRQSRHPQAQNFCLKTATGEDIAVHLSSSQKFWLAFCDAMGRPDLAEDARFTTYERRTDHYFELAHIVEAEFLKKPALLWEKLLSANDVPFAPVLTMGSFIAHPQTEWLQLVERERNGLALVRPPWRFGGERPERSSSPPRVGQDTRDIAAEVYDTEHVEELLAAGVLFADD